jgi:hypothetical protein
VAGAGYRTFIPGETLTADNVQNYLQDQVVQVYADATARDSNLTGLVAEGMVAFLKSDNKLYSFNGSTWDEVTPTNISADIINAGTLGTAYLPVVPIANGGTGGTTVVQAKANIGIHVSAGTPTPLAVGDIWID